MHSGVWIYKKKTERKEWKEESNQKKYVYIFNAFHFLRAGKCFRAAYLNIISNHLWVKSRKK